MDFSGKGWAVSGLLFFAVLTIAFAMGAWSVIMHLVMKPSLRAATMERASIARWPEIPATLFRLTLIKARAGRGNGVIYKPKVEYRYSVGSATYVGNQLRIGESWRWTYQAHNAGDFRLIVATLAPGLDFRKFLDAPQCEELPSYESCSVSFDLDQPLRVHVDPENPQNSVIDNDDLPGENVLNHWVSPLTWIACLLLALFASMLSAWRMFLRLLNYGEAADPGNGQSLALRCWRVVFGFLFLGASLESYIMALDWRSAPASLGELFGWVPGFALCAVTGLLGIYLVFMPAIERKLRRGRRRRRRR